MAAITSSKSLLKSLVDVVNRSIGIDRLQLVSLSIEIDQWLCLLPVHIEAVANCFFVVVLSLQQFATRIRTFIEFFL